MKLAELAGATIAFIAIKRLTDTKPTAVTATPAAKPLIGTLGPAAGKQDFNVFPTSLTEYKGKPSIDPLLPTGPIKQPGADLTFFPKTATTAGKEFAAKDPFAGLAGLKNIIPITGLPTNFKIDYTKRPTD